MREKLQSFFVNRTSLIWLLTGFAGGALYGLLAKPFLLHFIDGVTLAGFFLLAGALLRNAWMDGSFAFFSWKAREESYTDYRQKISEERRQSGNPLLMPALVLLTIGIMMSVAYAYMV